MFVLNAFFVGSQQPFYNVTETSAGEENVLREKNRRLETEHVRLKVLALPLRAVGPSQHLYY